MNQDSQRFSRVAGDPFLWLVQANDLMTAGRVLVETSEATRVTYLAQIPDATGRVAFSVEQQIEGCKLRLPQVAFMLFGLAFEVLLKGVLVGRRPELVGTEKLDDKFFGNHNLAPLFQEVGIALLSRQCDLVDRLSESVHWAGRYPVPKKKAAHQFRQLPDGVWFLPGTVLPGDLESIEALWEQLVQLVEDDSAIAGHHTKSQRILP